MQIKINTLELSNFKGVRNFRLAANGMNVQLRGANDTGKTTIGDALCWLLFDKDQQNKTANSFGIKTRINGLVQNQLEHSVYAEISVLGADGSESIYNLKKVYAETWTRRQGSDSERLTGHSVSYFFSLDGSDVAVNAVAQAEYLSRIEQNMGNLETLKMLLLPSYFADQIDDKTRRSIITRLTSDIKPGDVVAANPDLQGYLELRGSLDHDQAKKRVNNELSLVKSDLEGITPRIDENMIKILEVAEPFDVLSIRIDDLKARHSELSEMIRSGYSEEVVRLRESMDLLAAEKNKLRDSYGDEYIKNRQAYIDAKTKRASVLQDLSMRRRAVLDKLVITESRHRVQVQSLREKIRVDKSEAESLLSNASNLLESAKNVHSETCPHCDQLLPESMRSDRSNKIADQIKAVRKMAAERTANAVTTSEQLDALIAEHNAAVLALNSDLAEIDSKKSDAQSDYDLAEQALNEYDLTKPDVNDSAEYKAMLERESALREKIQVLKSNHEVAMAPARQELESVSASITEVESMLGIHKNNEAIRQRIDELNRLRESLKAKLVQAERNKILVEKFERAEAALITGSINSYFQNVSFLLFKDQINGGLSTCCEVVYKGVPWSEGLNASGKVRAGVEITSVLCNLFGLVAPVLVDAHESVDNLPETPQQIIAMIKDKNVHSLTLEPYTL